MNILISICSVAAMLIAIIAYQRLVYAKAKEKRMHVFLEFTIIKTQNTQILEQLIEYTDKNNCAAEQFTEGKTFAECIHLLSGLEDMLADPEFETALKNNLKYLKGSDAVNENLIKDVAYWQNALFTVKMALRNLS